VLLETRARRDAPRRPLFFVLSGLLLLAVLRTSPAGAQQDTSFVEEEARSLFAAGRAAYADGRYGKAIEHFQRAYEISGHPELLYNIGQAADRLRRDEEALAAFTEFLERLPDTGHRREVENRISALRAAIASRESSAAPREEPPGPEVAAAQPIEPDEAKEPAVTFTPDAEPKERRSIARKWWFWTITGVILAGAGVGLGLALGGGDATVGELAPVNTGVQVMTLGSRR
jgi:tetratricopeptide (TPR) repeat protein